MSATNEIIDPVINPLFSMWYEHIPDVALIYVTDRGVPLAATHFCPSNSENNMILSQKHLREKVIKMSGKRKVQELELFSYINQKTGVSFSLHHPYPLTMKKFKQIKLAVLQSRPPFFKLMR